MSISTEKIDHTADEFTQESNKTGELTAIARISPSRGQVYHLVPDADGQIPLMNKLYDGNGDLLPQSTQTVLMAKTPSMVTRQQVSDPVGTYQPWRSLSIKEQRDDEFQDSIRVPIRNRNQVHIRDVDELIVGINSSAAVDWSQAGTQMYFEDGLYVGPKDSWDGTSVQVR